MNQHLLTSDSYASLMTIASHISHGYTGGNTAGPTLEPGFGHQPKQKKVFPVETISIRVSPNVIHLCPRNEKVTVYTNIAYNQVSVSSVFLNGMRVAFSDKESKSNFIATFHTDDIRHLSLTGNLSNSLVLIGATFSGKAFSGKQEIKIIKNQA